MTTQGQRLELQGLVLTPDRVGELDAGRMIVSVDRPDVRMIRVRRGFEVKHPIVQIILGLGLCALGLSALYSVILWLLYGGVMSGHVIMFTLCAIIGVWLLLTALHRGTYLHVEMDCGYKRLFFKKPPPPEELDAFLSHLELWNVSIVREA